MLNSSLDHSKTITDILNQSNPLYDLMEERINRVAKPEAPWLIQWGFSGYDGVQPYKTYFRKDNPVPAFSSSRFGALVKTSFDQVMKLSTLKGGEYSGDDDRLANFRRLGIEQDLPMESIWRVYAAKHWDAIGQYIKDERRGVKRERLETIGGRVDDLLVYLLLFKAMLEEANFPAQSPSFEEDAAAKFGYNPTTHYKDEFGVVRERPQR